jgi:hypothetical protein
MHLTVLNAFKGKVNGNPSVLGIGEKSKTKVF